MGTGGVPNASGPGTATCSGTITATFTWNDQGNSANEPPDIAVVKEVATASWIGDIGQCANGLGSPVTPLTFGGTSSGTRYTSVESPGQSFQVTCSPLASSYFSEYSTTGLIGGNVSVAYQASAHPIRIHVTGINPTTNTMLIGQKLVASISTGGLPAATNQVWNVSGSGAPFSDYQATQQSATYTGWTAPSTGTSSIEFYLAKPLNATITCEFDLTFAGLSIGLKHPLLPQEPSIIVDSAAISSAQMLPVSAPTMFGLKGLTLGPDTVGMYQLGWIETPEPYRHQLPPELDFGGQGHCQLIVDESKYGNPGEYFQPVRGLALDGNFPYNNWVPTDDRANRWFVFSDSPRVETETPGQLISYAPIAFDHVFNMFTLYLAPANAAGQSKIVPVRRKPWTFKATASYSSNWSVTNYNTGLGTLVDYPPHPTWNQFIGIDP